MPQVRRVVSNRSLSARRRRSTPWYYAVTVVFGVILGVGTTVAAGEPQWRPLFNGRDLDGWTPKFAKHELGENFHDTFRVADGLLQVRYDEWDRFDEEFGHLFYKEKFSHYRVRVEYRFVDGQVRNGPGWAVRNSGIMLHCQDPATMRRDQDFPVSLEMQFLGGDGTKTRSTGNLCTPGTHVVYEGKLLKRHCTGSRSSTFHGDQWVTAEAEVHGDRLIRHIINGEVVMEYEQPHYDDADGDARKLAAESGKKLVGEGFLSLQAESHPIDFRKVEVLVLGD